MREYKRSVFVKDDNIERALRKFKKKITDQGLLNELRDRETYEKPTTRRKRKKSAAKNRWCKQLVSQQLSKKLY
jgi:small subunit ribosomal protein S21